MVQAVHSGRFFFYSALTLVFTLFGLSGCGGSSGGSSTPEMSINNPSVAEGGESDSTTLTFTLSLSETADEDLTVEIGTANGTAEAGEDYTARTGETLTIREGDTSATFTVDITGDDDFEQDETFSVQISNPQGPELEGSQTLTATGTITNDDNADRGYFAGTGTLNGTEYDDLIALVYNPRIMLFSPSANVLYDIQMNSYDDHTNYSGEVDVYVDGEIDQTLSITGQTDGLVLSGSFSDGTGTGTGFGEGSFSVTYDLENNEGATLTRVDTTDTGFWMGDIYSVNVVPGQLGFTPDGSYVGNNNNLPACRFDNGVTTTLPSEVNIFALINDVTQGVNCNYIDDNYTGFGSVIDVSGTDDGLIYAVTTDTYAVFSIMTRTP